MAARAVGRRGALARVADQQGILPAGEARGLLLVDAELPALRLRVRGGRGEQARAGLRILQLRMQGQGAFA
ncbi:hypothetical protein RLIN73S_02410 [Rhodanobacter lindaniclasticus]